MSTPMIRYFVTYNWTERDVLMADDAEHAVEQVLDYEPDAVINSVYMGLLVDKSAWIAAASNNEDNV